MVSAKFIGALALFSLGGVEASVCKPSPSSVASSGTGTASSFQSSSTESSFIETTSTAEPSFSSSDVSTSSEDVTSTLDSSTTFATLISTSASFDDASSTTEVTSTSGEVVESTTIAQATTTSAALDTTTTSVEATTSSAAPAPEPTFRLFTYDSQDPNLNGGIGYCKLEQVLGFFSMRFTPSSALAPTFKIDPTTGAVTVVSGPSGSTGESMISTTINGVFTSSYLRIIPEALIDTDAQEVVSCSIVEGQNNKLVCDWPGGGIADFWTCSGSWILVQPGYTLPGDFCSDPVYKIGVHAQFV